MKPNRGFCPVVAKGRRVRVQLMHGGVNTSSPNGWPADGSGGCNWEFRGSPFDIAYYEVIE